MKRTIKSYVLRAGRTSVRQQQGLTEHLTAYELSIAALPWHFTTIFGREADTIVEIGFGMGASLLTMAKAAPDVNFIGVEVHRAGIGALAVSLFEEEVKNVRIAPTDACEVFLHAIEDATLAGIHIFFPDPWPKKRHHKRRLIQAGFVELLAKKLKKGGFLHCATDWKPYAEHMLDVLGHEPLLKNQQEEGGFIERPDTRPFTKFEVRGTHLGHEVCDLIFVRR